MLGSCNGEQRSGSEEQENADVNPIDTLVHGVKQQFTGYVLDSIITTEHVVNFSEPTRLDFLPREIPVPDTVYLTAEAPYKVPGKDTLKAPVKLDMIYWKTRMIYPGSKKVTKPFSRDISQFDIRYLSKESGLPSSAIYYVMKDDQSDLWMALVTKGILHYDGNEIIHFTKEHGLPGNNFQFIYQDAKSHIWICGKDGLSRFDGQYFHNYRMPKGMTSHFSCIQEDKEGNIWFGGWDNGLVKMSPSGEFYQYTFEQGFDAETVYCMKLGPDGNLWIGLRRAGLGIYDGKGFSYYSENTPLTASVRAIDFTVDGEAWLGTEAGLLRFDGDRFVDYQNTEILGKRLVWSVLVDHKERLWTATYRNGLSRFDGHEALFHNRSSGLSSNTSRSMLEDDHGRIWMGTDDGGLNILNPEGFEYIRKMSGFGMLDIRGIHRSGEYLYLTSYGYDVFRFKNGSIEVMEEGFDRLVSHLYADRNGALWMAGFHGLCVLKGDVLRRYPEFMNNLRISCFAEDHEGRVWMGQDKGFVIYDPKDESFLQFSQEGGFPDVKVLSILPDGKNVWIGTNGSGLYQYDGKDFMRYSVHEGLSNEFVVSLNKNEEGIWIGTAGGGVFLFQDERFQNFTTKDGLSGNYVKDVEQDSSGRLWIITENGLSVREDGLFIAHDFESGMNMGDFHKNSSFMDEDGTLWCGSRVGITRVQTKNYQKDTVLPEVELNDVLLHHRNVDYRKLQQALNKGEDFQTEDGGVDLSEVAFDSILQFKNCPVGLELPYSINELTFDFSASDINGAQEFQYSYVLEGSESDWSPFRSENTARFTNLQSGEYVFKVKAKNQFGVTSEAYVYPFIIRTPWWETTYAYVAYGFLFLLGFYLFFRIRTARFRARQRVLEQTVTERTHELKLQKEEVELKNLEISDSINYAKRIQEAILPADKYFKNHLPDSFIYYQPKDIVAGDFYWMDVVEVDSDPIILFAVADCTGHGVPGAMVSVVCNEALNRSVKEFHLTQPSDILDQTRKLVLNSFAKSDREVNDGMDIALCALQGNQLSFSGANNPLWLLRSDEIIEIKGDKQPIGRFEREFPFTNHVLELLPEDRIFLFSDGYPDQFGGSTSEQRSKGGKKFKYKNFKKLLVETAPLETEEQKLKITEFFEAWKGDLEQLDDVCVIGVRI